MKTRVLFLAMSCAMVLLSAFKPPAHTVAIIVNVNNPVERLTPSLVRIYWLRAAKKRWPGINVNIKPVNRKGKSVDKDIFLSRIIEMKEQEVETYFTAKQYQYAEVPPEKLASDNEIIDYVAEEQGAIAFVNLSSVQTISNPKVKVVYQIVD